MYVDPRITLMGDLVDYYFPSAQLEHKVGQLVYPWAAHWMAHGGSNMTQKWVVVSLFT